MKGLQRLSIAANRFGEDGANSLSQGLVTNVSMMDLSMPRGFDASGEIDYLLALNYGGRRLLVKEEEEQSAVIVPLGLWPLVFEHVQYCQPSLRASVIFYLLQGPAVFGR
jgi:hypothetical protein